MFRHESAPLDPAIAAAFRIEERRGARLAAWARLGALAVVAAWVMLRAAGPTRLYYSSIIALLVLSGLGQLWCRGRIGRAAALGGYVLVALDMILLTVAIIVPSPLAPEAWPPAMQLRLGNFDFFYLLIAFAVLGFRPLLPLWAAIAAALAWSLGVWWVLVQPGSFTVPGSALLGLVDLGALLAVLLDPDYVSSVIWAQELILAILVAAILSVAVWRARRLALRQATASRERANLARYFPPTVVEELATQNAPLGQTRQQPVAVMFADIIGFTEFAERTPADQVVATLRAFHQRLEQAIFDQRGTLDKFLGDGVMATFGTPRTGEADAARSLAAARAMLRSIEAWNRTRVAAGETPIRLSIGIHYGPVVLGDIGSERRLEFAVLGDVVNVASRIENLTRRLGTSLVVSGALVDAIRAEPASAALLADLSPAPPQDLRGRAEPVAVWTLNEHA